MNARQFKLGFIERGLQAALRWVVVKLLRTPARALTLGDGPLKVVVLRFDARLGNQVLLTPLLASLTAQLPKAQLSVMGAPGATALIGDRCDVAHFRVFRAWALLGATGLFQTVRWLRRQRFDLCIDASNPTHPSLTHAVLARLSKARHTVGSELRGLGPLRTAPVRIPSDVVHEIDLRLALLAPLGPGPRLRLPQVVRPKVPRDSDIHGFLAAVLGVGYGVINVGARLANKQLGAADYAVVANLMTAQGLTPIITWGPHERLLAEQAVALAQTALLAPPTSVAELSLLFEAAAAVVSCDTGPMHLSVALGRPTCGLFVSTLPERYGYSEPPHAAIETRGASRTTWSHKVRDFLQGLGEHSAYEPLLGPTARLRRPPPEIKSWPEVRASR